NKPTDRKNKILLIKATDLVERKNTESYLTNEHISIITSIYTRYTNIDGRSKIINNNEIPDNKYSISPKFYVKSNDPKDIEDISELLENWKSNSESLHESFTNLIDLL
ncbi:N-6 DNA methylase, partial [Bacteroides thetaiotaomicron]